MSVKLMKNRRLFECMLIAVVLGMAYVAYRLGGQKLVVLNLFYLPIILSGYFLGRGSACVLAVLCALAVTIAAALDPTGFAAEFSPLLGGFALACWAAVLGLCAILIGTLCDERAAVVDELHEAYVGVVEVLSRYLQSGHPRVKARSIRVAELSQAVAADMKLPRKHIDDIRVGALLFDLGNVEITTRLIARAMDNLETTVPDTAKHTFPGMDLVHSLGSVLHGTVPLLLSQDEQTRGFSESLDGLPNSDLPIGAKIIRAVRAYDALAGGGPGEPKTSLENALQELQNDPSHEFDENVLKSLERVVRRNAQIQEFQPAYA